VLAEESFRAGQAAGAGDVASALAQVAARFAAGDDDLAAMVRARQALMIRQQMLDRQLLESYAGNAIIAERPNLLAELAATSEQLEQADVELLRRFPAYAELTDPSPVSAAETGALLNPDEALLSYVMGDADDAVYLWVVRPGSLAWRRLDLTPENLADRVGRLRASLDLGQGGGTGKHFSVGEAAILRALLLPDEAILLDGARSLLIVPEWSARATSSAASRNGTSTAIHSRA
jgi:hypothetical protein